MTRNRRPAREGRHRPARGRRRRRGRRWPWVVLLLLLLGSGALAWLIWPFWQLSGQFGSQPAKQPSRLYGAPRELRVGAELTAEALIAELGALGYRRLEPAATPAPGTFSARQGEVAILRRRFPPPEVAGGRQLLRVRFDGGVISGVEASGKAMQSVRLDRPLIASYYGPELRERRPVGLDELPEETILAVLAAEDAYFLEHKGFSLVGTLRALWVNLRAREVRQGGSTLTQQLVKNLYLTQRRTLLRKLQEAVLAVFLELRFEKRAILEAYLNEIYWGRSGNIDLMGIGAAAFAYFGKHPSELDLAESALLAGIIPSPATMSPLVDPKAARERRDFVLERLAQLGWLATDRLERASRRGALPTRPPLVARRAPYFAAFAEGEARRRFGVEALADAGFVLHSTLSLANQQQAEAAVRSELPELEKRWEKERRTGAPLEAALISADPRSGGILAYVGGRSYARSQFDRVTQARRQAGSAFKPIVYAAAYADLKASPATFLNDAPLSVRRDGQVWIPKNSDGRYRGRISSRAALEQSLNVPTARLALDVGLDRVVATARKLGITSRLDPYPALALGSMEVSPIEMATVYATLAGGGRRPQLYALAAVYDRHGVEVTGERIEPPAQELPADVAYVVNTGLRGVLDRGTGKGARQQGIEDALAGKTGTTNSRRDSWFAGYSPDRVSLVWVGYDDNSKTRLSGARAALPIWSRFTGAVRPAGGYPRFERPEGVVVVRIDPSTGGLATGGCPQWFDEVFLSDNTPGELCREHGGRPLEQPEGAGEHEFRDWLDMVEEREGG